MISGMPERSADFDQFAARSGNFLAIRQAVQNQQDRGGVIVHNRGRFRARELAKQFFEMSVAVSALAIGQIEFQIRGFACGQSDGLDRFFGQRGSPKIRMKHRTRQIEDAAQGGLCAPSCNCSGDSRIKSECSVGIRPISARNSARACASTVRIARVTAERPNSAIRTAASPCCRRRSTEGSDDNRGCQKQLPLRNSDSPNRWTGYNSIDMATQSIRLTEMAHGGGCGCKLSPAVLGQILAKMPLPAWVPSNLLVGTETDDDAAVYQINEHQAIVATTDFFMPVVDDPFDFGRIAATNALSDVYAMGGTPIMALAVVGMPVDKMPREYRAGYSRGRRVGVHRRGNPGGGRAFDRFAGADLWFGRDRPRRSVASDAQQHGARRRQNYFDQAPGRRHLQRGSQAPANSTPPLYRRKW